MTEPAAVSPEVFLAMGREVLAQQPFSVLIGAEVVSLSAGRCELQVPVSDAVKQQNGFVHGGVVSYAADNALTFAGGTALGVPVVTSEFKINYLRPAIGVRLLARAEAVHAGRTQAVCRCDVFVVKGGWKRSVRWRRAPSPPWRGNLADALGASQPGTRCP